ncbi:hypothetical protein ACFHW2_28435 [Actinomadura sp. LOL_016]|uniref:hypothetical protein n=1 Tax=unclassified Actinomadura TaxID=2626254 RepID=UPI003A80AB40
MGRTSALGVHQRIGSAPATECVCRTLGASGFVRAGALAWTLDSGPPVKPTPMTYRMW